MELSFLPDRIAKQIRLRKGCWIWTGGKSNTYGSTYFAGKRHYLHRLVYELVRGPIQDGYVIDHLCHHPLCCNPAHLEAVTLGENFRRAQAARTRTNRIRAAYLSWKTRR